MKNSANSSIEFCLIESSKMQMISEFLPNWFFDKKNYSIFNEGQVFYLTQKELLFFTMLLENRVVTFNEMHNCVWLENKDLTKNAMVSFVKNFKKKLPPKILKNIYGVGYMLIK